MVRLLDVGHQVAAGLLQRVGGAVAHDDALPDIKKGPWS